MFAAILCFHHGVYCVSESTNPCSQIHGQEQEGPHARAKTNNFLMRALVCISRKKVAPSIHFAVVFRFLRRTLLWGPGGEKP